MSTSSMRISTDWKFVIMLVVTIVGVGAPIWLWYADQSSHSLRVTIVSQTALQPSESNTVSGLKFSIDGREVKSPYLTVANIKNDGAKPISVADFEGPLEIRSLEQTRIIRAQLTETHPKDIQPTITSNINLVKLKPLLLNSNDSITVAILTTGEPPRFSVRARIAGIPIVELENSTPIKKMERRAWLVGLTGFGLLVIYSSSMFGFLRYQKNGFQVSRWYALFVALFSVTGSILLMFLEFMDSEPTAWQGVLFMILAVVIGAAIYHSQQRKPLQA